MVLSINACVHPQMVHIATIKSVHTTTHKNYVQWHGVVCVCGEWSATTFALLICRERTRSGGSGYHYRVFIIIRARRAVVGQRKETKRQARGLRLTHTHTRTTFVGGCAHARTLNARMRLPVRIKHFRCM